MAKIVRKPNFEPIFDIFEMYSPQNDESIPHSSRSNQLNMVLNLKIILHLIFYRMNYLLIIIK